MYYRYSLKCGSGSTNVDIAIETDLSFRIKIHNGWMGSKKLNMEMSGIYENTSNNYYLLKANKIGTDSQNIDIEDNINIEFITLTGKQQLIWDNYPDPNVACITCANAGSMNTSNNFDAIMTCFITYNVEQNRKAKEIDNLVEGYDMNKILRIIRDARPEKIDGDIPSNFMKY